MNAPNGIAFMMEDPMLLSALAAHGLLPEEAEWEQCDQVNGMAVRIPECGEAPQIYIHNEGEAHLLWRRPLRDISYDRHRDGDFRVVTIGRTAMPLTILDAMPGKTLDTMVDLPGANRMTMIRAINSRPAGETAYDTRIEVEPFALAAIHPIIRS